MVVKDLKIQHLLIESCQKKPLGQILLEAGLISIGQIELALQEQQESGLKIGEIISIHKWINQKTVDFFAKQWKQLIQAEEKHPLIYYFQEAGLLDEQEIKTLLEIQQQSGGKSRFHHVVVKQGYLKQITVDYFLTYLFGFYNPNKASLNKLYEIIKGFIKGEKDFQNSDLRKAPLMNVTLKGIKLDGSNLRKANFYDSNLSYSSFAQVNLTRADLAKAILTEANFEQASLRKANLQQSYLEKANFKLANLQQADLRNAYLASASFEFADLSGANLKKTYLIGIEAITPKQIKSACFWEEAIYKEDETENQKYIEELKKDKLSDPIESPNCSIWG